MLKKKTAAIIVDKNSISLWQKEVLDEIKDIVDIKIVLNCENTKTKKRPLKHGMYYLLNILALKNKHTKTINLNFNQSQILNFSCEYEGSWQIIPEEVVEKIKNNKIDLIIKCGMSLLRIKENLEKIPIFSYHHGDPSKYRGRPAGFYEILNDEREVGVIVQRLSNVLDGGQIYALGKSRIEPHSYRKTAENAYMISKHLLRKALVNYFGNNEINLPKEGKNYRLPSNSKVLLFAVKITIRKIKRLIYGAFFEKKWNVGILPGFIEPEKETIIQLKDIEKFDKDQKYNFYADPFFSADGRKVRLEALRKKTGLGDILEIDLHRPENSKVLFSGKHFSYPFSISEDNQEYLLPETASHSNQFFVELNGSKLIKTELRALESKRIVDATLYRHNDCLFIFFTEAENPAGVLHLYYAKNIRGDFVKHPQSPICIDPTSARMGGRILKVGGNIFRFGQNNSRGYGESLSVMKVIELSQQKYQEHYCGSIAIQDMKGPHCMDYSPDSNDMVIDFYEDKFDLLAGWRRFIAKLN